MDEEWMMMCDVLFAFFCLLLFCFVLFCFDVDLFVVICGALWCLILWRVKHFVARDSRNFVIDTLTITGPPRPAIKSSLV
jgi:hypothetical protein